VRLAYVALRVFPSKETWRGIVGTFPAWLNLHHHIWARVVSRGVEATEAMEAGDETSI